MTELAEVTEQLERRGYAVVPGRLAGPDLTRAQQEIGGLLATAGWGSGFDGSSTRRVWALLPRTRCMDRRSMAKRFIESRIWEW